MSHHPCNHYCWYLIFFSFLVNQLSQNILHKGSSSLNPWDICPFTSWLLPKSESSDQPSSGFFWQQLTHGAPLSSKFSYSLSLLQPLLFSCTRKALGKFFFLLCSFFSCLFFFGSSKVTFLSHLYVHSYFYFIITPFYSFHKLMGKVMFKYQK